VSTSIRDLLGQVAMLQTQHQTSRSSPQAATDARLAIGAAGAVLGKLDVWRPDWTFGHKARRLTNQLQAACVEVHAGNDPHSTSRSHALMAAASDAAGILCEPSIPGYDRWTMAVAVADVVRRSTAAFAANGPVLADPTVAAARSAAIDVARAALLSAPSQEHHRGLIDLPIPAKSNLIADPLSRAAAAAAEIDHLLARAVAAENRGFISIYELRAVALTFQHTVQRATAALDKPPERATAAWTNVRGLARLLHDGLRPAIDAPEILLRRAAQLHQDLDRHADSELDTGERLAFAELLLHAANSADSLTHHTYRMAGRVYARADRFPVTESRVQQHLGREPFIADINDLAILRDALRAAEQSTSELAYTLADPVGVNLRIEPYPLTNPLVHLSTVPAQPGIAPAY
jgi:hypothetical protein